MDEMFDLDLALTMPEEDSTRDQLSKPNQLHEAQRRSAAARLLVEEMPAAAATGGSSECTVCMQGLGSGGGGGAKEVPCGHIFHESCILQWLSIHSSCPLCRRNLFSSCI